MLAPRDAALVLGATMRLSRLVVTDDLGGWLFRYPLWRWSSAHNPVPPAPEVGSLANTQTWSPTWRDKIATGIDCPFCVGTWIGFGVLAITELLPGDQPLGKAWRFVMAGLTLNEVAAHLGARLGDTAGDDTSD